MWYPAKITTPPASEPVTADQAKAQCRIDGADDDALIARLIAAARSHVEACTGSALVPQTITAKCDCFADLARLPFAPVQSITSIAYVDQAGVDQTLATSVYETRIDGLDGAIVLKYGQAWPAVQPGSRLTVTAALGYGTLPPAILHAILLLIGHWYVNREAVVIDARAADIEAPIGFAELLTNFRVGA